MCARLPSGSSAREARELADHRALRPVPIRNEVPAAPWSVPPAVLLGAAAELAPHVGQDAIGEAARLEVGLEGRQRLREQRRGRRAASRLVVVRVVAAVGVQCHAPAAADPSSISASTASRCGEAVARSGRSRRPATRVGALQRRELAAQRRRLASSPRRAARQLGVGRRERARAREALEIRCRSTRPRRPRVEPVALGRGDRGDRHLAGASAGASVVVQRQALQRVVGAPCRSR